MNPTPSKMPLDSTFAYTLALQAALVEAIRILDNPSSNAVEKMLAENTIQMILTSPTQSGNQEQ